MMRDAILAFAKQFEYTPVIENKGKLKKNKSFLLTGMGGSHLNADMLLRLDPFFDLTVLRDYGLPEVPKKKMRESLFIASSYSGNTEEVLEAYKEAKKNKLSMAAIAVGGKLIEWAKKDGIPYIQLPNTGIQPRSALALSTMALMKLVGRNDLLRRLQQLKSIDPKKLESQGKALAKKMHGRVPVVYSSRKNETLAWNWKIKLNETGKIPAFYNVFPELNHNEMTGFDVQAKSRALSEPFHVVILRDPTDHPKNIKRMTVVEKLYKKRKIPVTVLELSGNTDEERLFTSLLVADWTAVHTALLYDHESEQVPMVEEFKKMIA